MEKYPEFDDIRPYYDDEVAPVIERLIENVQFREVINYLFPKKEWEQFKTLMKSFTNKYDFQRQVVKDFVFELIRKTAAGVECNGLENISKTGVYTYISNHRDIVLDASILCAVLMDYDYDTTEIAIGDNLLLADWIKDVVRLNKSFIVKRSLSLRQILEEATHLSKYIHLTIQTKKQSIWIAQREGRAKDSNDRTQESVLKMLAMGGDKNFLKSLMELNIAPVTLSYEYDPCDYLKAKELQQRRDDPDFKKSPQDDLLNMQTGLFGYKGNIHLQIGRPIHPVLEKMNDSLSKNELVTQITAVIDKEIFLNYKFYPVNYIAYDRLWGDGFFRNKYTSDDIKTVDSYLQQQLDKIDLPEKDSSFLAEKIAEMYAYPVKNFLSISEL